MVPVATPAAVLSIIVEANTGKAEAALKEFQRNLSKADREKAEAEFAFQVEKGGYNVFSGLVKKADAMSADANLEFDVDQASLAKAQAAQAVLTKESQKLGDVFNRSQLSIGQWATILTASLPVVFDLAGALGALTASLGAATAGVGALGVGLGAVATVGFGGIAAIAAPAISSLGDLMTAQEAATKAQTTGAASSARAAAASAQQISAAHDQVISAERQLEMAQASAELAQESLTQAREDAVRQLQDMRRAAMGADESEESARIGLRRAQQSLNQIMADATSSNLDVREAENAVALARINLRDVTIAGNRAQEDYNKAQKGGINEMPGVVSAQQSLDSALRGVRDAHDGVSDALENLAQQQKEANMAAEAGATSMAALALAQKKAGPEVVKFAAHLKSLGERWQDLTKAGRANFIGMLDDGITRLNKKLPLLAKSANSSMAALRRGFGQFLDRATGPEFDHFIHVMTRTFAKSIGPVARAFGNIGKVLQRIAVAVAPDIVKMARGFEAMTEGWVESTRNASRLRETIHGLVGQTRAWWNLLVAAKDLIVAALVPGMQTGKKAVQEMTGQLREWTNWINAHPEATRDFFKEAMKTTKLLARTLVGLVPVLFQLSKAMRPITTVFLKALQALSALKFGNISALTLVLGAIVASKIINGVRGLVGSFVALRTALFGAAAAETALGAATTRTTAAMTAQQVMAKSSMFGGGLAKTTAGGGIAGGVGGAAKAGTAAGTAFSRAAGAVVRTAWPLAVGYGIFKSFTTSGGIIDTIKGKGSATGAEMGESMASGFIEEFQPKVNRAIRNLDFKGLDRISGKTQKMIDVFDEAGIEIPDALRKFGRATENQSERAKKAMERWQSSVGQLKHVIFRSMDDIKDKTKDALRDINRIQGISNERREDMVVKTYRAEIRTIEKSMKLGLIAHRKGHREIEKIQRQILRAYGVKDVQRLIVSDRALLA